jgi:hypothetical protein
MLSFPSVARPCIVWLMVLAPYSVLLHGNLNERSVLYEIGANTRVAIALETGHRRY